MSLYLGNQIGTRNAGEVLLDRGRRQPQSQALDRGRDVHGLDVAQFDQASALAPVGELESDQVVCLPGFPVADIAVKNLM